jgi:hypothetical protein
MRSEPEAFSYSSSVFGYSREEAEETDLLSLSDYKTSKKHDTAARLFSKSEKINNLLTANSLPSV